MRKLIMWNLITLDGYFEGKQSWDLDFHQTVWGEELERYTSKQLESAGSIIFGKNTYVGMAEYWSKEKDAKAGQMNSIKKYVCSTTLENADWNNTTIIKDALVELPKLKAQEGDDLFVFGSGTLSESIMKADLFDEYRLCIAPVFLGEGKRLFNEGLPYQKVKLREERTLKSGGIITMYAVNL